MAVQRCALGEPVFTTFLTTKIGRLKKTKNTLQKYWYSSVVSLDRPHIQ